MIFWCISDSKNSLNHLVSAECLYKGCHALGFVPLCIPPSPLCPAPFLHRKFLQDKKIKYLTLACIPAPAHHPTVKYYLLWKVTLTYVLTFIDD